jgi:hypothetical protein
MPRGRQLQRRFAALFALAALTLLFTGCAYRPVVQIAAPGGAPVTEQSSWWAARYRHVWPQNEEPRWHQDMFVAHEIVLPVLNAQRRDIALWRFHRRAARDGAGHQFTFYFYAPAGAAERIFAGLRARPALAELKSAGLLREDVYHDTGFPEPQRIEGTSDRSWTPLVQASWPYFIMGVSENWLALVTLELARRPLPDQAGLDERIEACRQAQSSIDVLWRREGHHAYLHHLNALFGYTPLLMPNGEELGF